MFCNWNLYEVVDLNGKKNAQKFKKQLINYEDQLPNMSLAKRLNKS